MRRRFEARRADVNEQCAPLLAACAPSLDSLALHALIDQDEAALANVIDALRAVSQLHTLSLKLQCPCEQQTRVCAPGRACDLTAPPRAVSTARVDDGLLHVLRRNRDTLTALKLDCASVGARARAGRA